jgi:hypothetical protein
MPYMTSYSPPPANINPRNPGSRVFQPHLGILNRKPCFFQPHIRVPRRRIPRLIGYFGQNSKQHLMCTKLALVLYLTFYEGYSLAGNLRREDVKGL